MKEAEKILADIINQLKSDANLDLNTLELLEKSVGQAG